MTLGFSIWVHGFLTKRPVVVCAREVGVEVSRVAVSWMLLTEWMDRETSDGHASGLDAEAIDGLVGLCGFAAAMEKQGWLRFTDGGVSVVDWQKYHSIEGVRRLLDSRRKRDEREWRRRGAHSGHTQDKCPGSVQSKGEGGTYRGEGVLNLPSEKVRTEKTDTQLKQVKQEPLGFTEFWKKYPKSRRISKTRCLAIWERKKLENVSIIVVAGLDRWLKSQQWADGFVPNATTFLNGEMWEAEPEFKGSGEASW